LTRMSSGENCLSKNNVPIGKLFLLIILKFIVVDRPKIDQSIRYTYYIFQKTCTHTNPVARTRLVSVFKLIPSLKK